MTSNHQLMKNTPLIYKCIPNYSNCVLPITLYIYKQDTLCSLFFFLPTDQALELPLMKRFIIFYRTVDSLAYIFTLSRVCPPNNHFGGCILYDEEENVNLARPRF